MSIRVCGPKSERLINFIARPLVGGMVMNHDDSAFNRHPNPVRGCAESVNWNLKGACKRWDTLSSWACCASCTLMPPSSAKQLQLGREHSNCTSWAQRTVEPQLRPPGN